MCMVGTCFGPGNCARRGWDINDAPHLPNFYCDGPQITDHLTVWTETLPLIHNPA